MCLVFGTETYTVNNCGRLLEIFWGRDASCGGVVGQWGYFTGHTWGSERGENLFHDSRHFFRHNLWRVGWFLSVVGKFVVGAVGWKIFCMACISALWSDLDTAFTLPKANMEPLKSHVFFHRNFLSTMAKYCCPLLSFHQEGTEVQAMGDALPVRSTYYLPIKPRVGDQPIGSVCWFFWGVF